MSRDSRSARRVGDIDVNFFPARVHGGDGWLFCIGGERLQQGNGRDRFVQTSASALMAARPTRSPVKEPGPDAAAKASMSCLVKPCLTSRAAIWRTSWAENAPPSRGARPRMVQSRLHSSRVRCCRLFRMCRWREGAWVKSLLRDPRQGVLPLSRANSTNSRTPPVLDGWTKT